MARGGGRAGRGAGGTVYAGRGPKVRYSLGVGRGREGRWERWKGKGWEAWGRAMERGGRARGCVMMCTGGGGGGEMWGTRWMYMVRDTGRLGHTARVGGTQGDRVAMVRAEGEAVRSAHLPIEDAKGIRDSTARRGRGDEMVKTGTNGFQPSLEGEEFRDHAQGADSGVRADGRGDAVPTVVRDSGQPAVTRDEARHMGRHAEAGQHNTRNRGSDRGWRRGRGCQHDRVEGARGHGNGGGYGAWGTGGSAAERPRRDRGSAGTRHAQDDFVYQGDSLRDC